MMMRLKYHATTATSVPTCSITVNALARPASSLSPKISSASITWAEEDTGRNSVRPCMSPRIMDLKYVSCSTGMLLYVE